MAGEAAFASSGKEEVIPAKGFEFEEGYPQIFLELCVAATR
jgi:hypothetical protein